jgi:hypothetical protein
MILVKTVYNQKTEWILITKLITMVKTWLTGVKSDLRILNGRTKGDSFGRATFHGNNGISAVDYIICDQELFEKTKYFVVKHLYPPHTYLITVK